MGQSSSSSTVTVWKEKGRRYSYQGQGLFGRKKRLSIVSRPLSLLPLVELEMVNINTATEEHLMTLPGIDRQLAHNIVKHREIIGPFNNKSDLLLIPGIGKEELQILRPEITTGLKNKYITRSRSWTSIQYPKM